MFHRVDDAMELPSSRFFRMAERLHLRDGAVRQTTAYLREEVQTTTPAPTPAAEYAPSASTGVAEGTADDIAAMAAMSQNPGFPGIGYSGG